MTATLLSEPSTPKFNLNQIVRGRVCGVFVVLDRKFCKYVGQYQYVLKAVNPDNLSETAKGQLALHEENLVAYN